MNNLFFRSLLLASLALTLLPLAKGQEVTAIITPETKYQIRGQVIDTLTNEPMAFCIVSILGTSLGGVTDTDGYFIIDQVPYPSPIARVNYKESEPKEVALRAGGMNIIPLLTSANDLQEMGEEQYSIIDNSIVIDF